MDNLKTGYLEPPTISSNGEHKETLGLNVARRPLFLNGLRAFEAAARHGSFTLAAKDLNVTQAAVSQQVRLLEERLGFALFRRHANGLELTDQGRAFQPGLTDAFSALERLTDQVAAMRPGPVLTVGVAPALAMNWLIPRLADSIAAIPRSRCAWPRAGRGFRCATTGRVPCVAARPMTGPAISPKNCFRPRWSLCARRHRKGVALAADLSNASLIVVAHLRAQWTWWFEAAGLSAPIQPAAEVSFENSPMAIKAVLDGVGVAVAQLPYVSDALGPAAWFRHFRSSDGSLKLVSSLSTDTTGRSGALIFRDWLHGEAELQRQAWEPWA